PAVRSQDHRSENVTRTVVAAVGTMTGETEESASGVFGSGLRSTTFAIQHNGVEKAAEEQLKSLGWKGTGRFALPSSVDLADPFAITAAFKLATAAGREVSIPVGLMTRVRPGNYLLNTRLEGRQHPFVCAAGRQIEEIDLTFANGLALPAVPQGRRIDNTNFSYLAQYRLDGRTLKVRREFVSKVAGQVCAPEIEAEVMGAVRSVAADLGAKIKIPAASGPAVASTERPAAQGQGLTKPAEESGAGAAAVALPNPSSQGSNRAWCAGSDNASADLRIRGCTALIQSGEGTAQSIAVAFANRGHAYRAKGDYRHAVEDFNQ